MRLRARLLEDIVAGVWPLGGALPLAELERRYGVSASPIREALLRLEGDGIVSVRPHHGASLPVVDICLLTETYEIVGALQAMLARRAATRAGKADLESIACQVERFEAALAEGDVARAVGANAALHGAINALGQNARAVALIETRSALGQAFRRLVGYGAGRVGVVVQQHRALLTALRRCDGDCAARLVLEHAETARDDLIARLRPAEPGPAGQLPA